MRHSAIEEVFSRAMGNYAYQMRSKDLEEVRDAVALHPRRRGVKPCISRIIRRRAGISAAPMEYKRYGHAGRPFVVFPTSNGRFFQYRGFRRRRGIGGVHRRRPHPGLHARRHRRRDVLRQGCRYPGPHRAATTPISDMSTTRRCPKLSASPTGAERRAGPEAALVGMLDGRFPRREFPVPFPGDCAPASSRCRAFIRRGTFSVDARRRHLLSLARGLPGRAERRDRAGEAAAQAA